MPQLQAGNGVARAAGEYDASVVSVTRYAGRRRLLPATWIALVALLVCGACATTPYEYAGAEHRGRELLRQEEPRVGRGAPAPFLDALGHWVLSIPSKLLLLNLKVDNHDISDETEQALLEYLDRNNLCDVKVLINAYDVDGQWSRLFRNREIHGFWRYSFGILTLVGYTAFPGRAFGGDAYNPFTNSLYIHSDLVPVVLHEGGHAKDFADRKRKGFYAAVRILPLVPLFQEATATGDALGYQRDQGQDERGSYPLLWGAWGSYVGGEAGRFGGPWWLRVASFPVAWLGKLTGWVWSKTMVDPPVAGPPRPQSQQYAGVSPPSAVEDGLPTDFIPCEPPSGPDPNTPAQPELQPHS